MHHLLALHQTLSSLTGVLFWPWFTFVFFFKDLAEIISTTAFLHYDHILPLQGISYRKVVYLSDYNIPPKTSKSRVFQGGLSRVLQCPFCQPHSFHLSKCTITEYADVTTRRRHHRKFTRATLKTSLKQSRLFFYSETCFHL